MTDDTTTNGTQQEAALTASSVVPRKKAGAPFGNVNRSRSGLRGSLLPKGCERLQRDLNEFRRRLEWAVISVRGKVDVEDACVINAAYEWERHRRLSSRWLRLNAAEMTPADMLNHSREAARATTERNRAIEKLKIETKDENWWAGSIPAANASQDGN